MSINKIQNTQVVLTASWGVGALLEIPYPNGLNSNSLTVEKYEVTTSNGVRVEGVTALELGAKRVIVTNPLQIAVPSGVTVGLKIWVADTEPESKIYNVLANAIQQAAVENMLESAPHSAAPTHAVDTIYGAGAIVRGQGANADNLYIMVGHTSNAVGFRGTSGAVGANSAPSGTFNGLVQDGTCTWQYYGKANAGVGSYPFYSTVNPAVATDVMNGFVAIVASANLNAIGLTREYVNNRTKLIARIAGYIRFNTNEVYADPRSSWDGGLVGGNYGGARAFMEFETSAQDYIALQPLQAINGDYNNGVSGYIEYFDIAINGRFLSESPLMYNTPNGNFTFLIDLKRFGKGNKTITIMNKSGSWGGRAPYKVFVKDNEHVWPTSPLVNKKISLEGDSLTQGGFNGMAIPRQHIEKQLMMMLGFNDYINTAQGGTSASGFSNSNPNGVTTYIQRLQFIKESGVPDIHFVGGFHNEVGTPTAVRIDAMYKYLQACLTELPLALIVVIPTFALSGDSLLPSVGNTYIAGQGNSLLDLEKDVKTVIGMINSNRILYIPFQGQADPFFKGNNFPASSWYHSGTGLGGSTYADSHLIPRAYDVFCKYIVNAIRKRF